MRGTLPCSAVPNEVLLGRSVVELGNARRGSCADQPQGVRLLVGERLAHEWRIGGGSGLSSGVGQAPPPHQLEWARGGFEAAGETQSNLLMRLEGAMPTVPVSGDVDVVTEEFRCNET
jgi:hypothetical protein